MRLRKECEHGRWESHGLADDGYPHIALCPGGEFLPEGALLIEKVDGEWPIVFADQLRFVRNGRGGTELDFESLRNVVGDPGGFNGL